MAATKESLCLHRPEALAPAKYRSLLKGEKVFIELYCNGRIFPNEYEKWIPFMGGIIAKKLTPNVTLFLTNHESNSQVCKVFQRVKKYAPSCRILSILWLEKCFQEKCKVSYEKYEISLEEETIEEKKEFKLPNEFIKKIVEDAKKHVQQTLKEIEETGFIRYVKKNENIEENNENYLQNKEIELGSIDNEEIINKIGINKKVKKFISNDNKNYENDILNESFKYPYFSKQKKLLFLSKEKEKNGYISEKKNYTKDEEKKISFSNKKQEDEENKIVNKDIEISFSKSYFVNEINDFNFISEKKEMENNNNAFSSKKYIEQNEKTSEKRETKSLMNPRVEKLMNKYLISSSNNFKLNEFEKSNAKTITIFSENSDEISSIEEITKDIDIEKKKILNEKFQPKSSLKEKSEKIVETIAGKISLKSRPSELKKKGSEKTLLTKKEINKLTKNILEKDKIEDEYYKKTNEKKDEIKNEILLLLENSIKENAINITFGNRTILKEYKQYLEQENNMKYMKINLIHFEAYLDLAKERKLPRINVFYIAKEIKIIALIEYFCASFYSEYLRLTSIKIFTEIREYEKNNTFASKEKTFFKVPVLILKTQFEQFKDKVIVIKTQNKISEKRLRLIFNFEKITWYTEKEYTKATETINKEHNKQIEFINIYDLCRKAFQIEER